MKFLLKAGLIVGVLMLFSCKGDYSDTKDGVQWEHFVSVKTLHEWQAQQKPVALFEVSKKALYDQGHLPNAKHLWRPDYDRQDFEYAGMLASLTQLEGLLSAKGVTPSIPIVLYDAKGGSDAMRVLWMLDIYGHQDIYVVNGGKVAWQQAGYALVEDLPTDIPSIYRFPQKENFDSYADLVDVKAAILDTNILLIDTRETEEYKGQAMLKNKEWRSYKKGAYAAGCIPTAIHFNWSNSVDLKGDHRLKSLKDLRYNFEQAGITPDKKIITYCHSGVRSMHTAYVLKEILGYPNVKNYDGSWIEWSYYQTMD